MSNWNFEDVPGLGVQPSDEQLLNFYLKNKIQGFENDRVNIFPTVDVRMHEPWELIELSFLKDQPWHFYSPPKKKYRNSNKAERTTKSMTGYWKVTGKDCKIMDQSTQMQIGIKRTLVFHEDRFPYGKRTSWVMNEYHPTFNFPNQRDFVLCKIKNKHDNRSGHEYGNQASNVSMSYGVETGSSSQNSRFPNIADQFSTLMLSNDDNNMTNQDEPRGQAYMQELSACVAADDYNVENTFQPYNQHHQEVHLILTGPITGGPGQDS